MRPGSLCAINNVVEESSLYEELYKGTEQTICSGNIGVDRNTSYITGCRALPLGTVNPGGQEERKGKVWKEIGRERGRKRRTRTRLIRHCHTH